VLDFLYLPTQFPVYPTGIFSASIYAIHVCGCNQHHGCKNMVKCYWKTTVEQDWPQMTIRWMCITCWIP